MSIKVGAIIAAGGSSQRMKGTDKMLASLCGVPVILRTCLAFQVNENISEIVVSVKRENVELVHRLLAECGISKLKKVVEGGATRFESIVNAFRTLSECDYVAIHDGARPLVSQKLINTCVETAVEYGSAVPVIPSADTLKKVENECVLATVDRASVYRVQTPQIFKKEYYAAALAEHSDSSYTDDCAMLEKAGYSVRTCDGAEENIKLTLPSDLKYAEFLLEGEAPMLRIGHGYDVHKLVEERKLILCGVDIPYEKGLLGHSDADVALHALMDSLLGAAALGDIGKLFPDTDPEFSGISSVKLLEKVVGIVNLNGYTIGNIDITIVAQRPKLAPYIDEMRRNISLACDLSIDAVSVKATTEEGLGFTGSGEGISATAVSSLLKK